VRVGIQGYCNAGVTKHLRDYLWIYVPAEEQRRAGVPEIVEAYLRQSGTLEKRLKPATGQLLRPSE
jgi:hypothetical protein